MADDNGRQGMDIVGKFYEAAFLPEYWPAVCDELAGMVEGYSGSILNISSDSRVRFVTSPHMTEAVEQFAQSDVRSPLPGKQLAKMPFAFMRDVDLLTPEEIENDALKNRILKPIGLKWQLGDAVLEPSGHMIVFDFLRQTADGPFTEEHCRRLNELKPDLLRAVFVASRLAFQEARTAAEALAAVGLPAMVISDSGRVTAGNALMEGIEKVISTRSDDRLRVADPAIQIMLDHAIAHAPVRSAVQSIPIPAKDDHPAVIINVIPIRRHARDVFSRTSALVVVNRVGQVGPPDLRVL